MLTNNFFHRIYLNFLYFGKPPWDTGQSPPELLEFIQSHPAGNALDLGCGTGMNCLTLAKAGWKTTGVDLAWKAIAKANRRFKENKLKGHFYSGNVLTIDEPDGFFNLVLDIGCYHSLPAVSRLGYQTNVFSWLHLGGSYLLYGHMPSEAHPSSVSLSELDIRQFQENLQLENRKDSEDRWGRKTVWLWFTKPAK